MTNTDLILAGMPDELPEIRALGVKSAVLGYRISDSGHLLSASPGQGFGGILVLSDDGSGSAESPAFDRQLASVLRRGRFLGVFADFDACTPPLAALTGRLSALCAKEGLALYVPEIFSVYAPDAFVLIGSDVAAGSFELRLAEQKSRFGERLALELVPMRADFLLPSQGRAHPLSEEALDSLGANDGYYEVLSIGSRALTKKGERAIGQRFGMNDAVWVANMDKLSVPFYQADAADGTHSISSDLLLGGLETVGSGQRHVTAQEVLRGLKDRDVCPDEYEWYIQMKELNPIQTSGMGLGFERFLLWALKDDDIRDMPLISRIGVPGSTP